MLVDEAPTRHGFRTIRCKTFFPSRTFSKVTGTVTTTQWRQLDLLSYRRESTHFRTTSQFLPREFGRKVAYLHEFQREAQWAKPQNFGLRSIGDSSAHGMRSQMCLPKPPHRHSGFALNWTVFTLCIITVSGDQILLQAKVRQRYSDDLFCQRAALQHWSVRLVREV